ncbi:MAG: hypothetical protein H6660_15610 [Ardenticatenaceae bacterium]|nr:hypothetical protein [Ardenticatenaceae bacterium]
MTNVTDNSDKRDTSIHVQGDYVQGDKVAGDKVAGDKNTVGNVSGSNTIAIGREASAQNETGPTYQFSGPVIGSAIGGGEVHAENIAGGDILINAEAKNKNEFQQQLQELKTLLAQAIAAHEVEKEDGETAVSDLQAIIEETAKETPRPARIQRRLQDIADVINAGVKTGTAVLKATPLIAALIKAANTLFRP